MKRVVVCATIELASGLRLASISCMGVVEIVTARGFNMLSSPRVACRLVNVNGRRLEAP